LPAECKALRSDEEVIIDINQLAAVMQLADEAPLFMIGG
jgi:hypothetical protein